MKNIHILTSIQPTKLILDHNNELCFNDTRYLKEYKNIYITSDEEIKDGDYYLYLKDNSVHKFIYKHHIKLLRLDIQKKIILTTDQDLIKDGVQAIDDEFLEWFVKNPSCERVETEIVEFGFDEVPICTYEIIIPKEEPKQENCCTPIGQIKRYTDCVGCDKKPKQERVCNCGLKESEHNVRHPFIPKQETLEYGLLQHIKMCLECNNESQAVRLLEKYGFEKQEGMHNEEEARIIWRAGQEYWRTSGDSITFEELTEKLKTNKIWQVIQQQI